MLRLTGTPVTSVVKIAPDNGAAAAPAGATAARRTATDPATTPARSLGTAFLRLRGLRRLHGIVLTLLVAVSAARGTAGLPMRGAPVAAEVGQSRQDRPFG